MNMNKNAKIFVAGHRGMVGSSIVRKLRQKGFLNLILKTSQELDLRNQAAVEQFFREESPEYVFLAAAKVGGILANNTYKGDFIYDNIMIQSNVIKSAKDYNVEKLLFLGSSCIYPKLAPQPLKEEYLLTGTLEPTNAPYAVAKISGIEMCNSFRDQYGSNFISVMPTNLYGPNDNYDLETSHVLPALIRKFHEAKVKEKESVVMWGTGSPRREFLHVDDLADACYFLMQKYSGNEFLNIGTGTDVSIMELALIIKEIVGFEGEIVNDLTKPDGTPRKLLDVSRLTNLGWQAKIDLKKGISDVYSNIAHLDWF